VQCLDHLFDLWMWGLQDAEGNDLSKHVRTVRAAHWVLPAQ
jgi:hypothetical protein